MIEIRFFGTARLNLSMKFLELEPTCAATVDALLSVIAARAGVPHKAVKQYLVYVNEVNIDKLKRFRTPIADGDKIMILSPSSGG